MRAWSPHRLRSVSNVVGRYIREGRREPLNSTQEPQRPEPLDHAGVAFHPPLLLALVLVVGFMARWLVPLNFLSRALAISIGPIVTAGSFSWFFWAVYTMRTGDASIPTSEPAGLLATSMHG